MNQTGLPFDDIRELVRNLPAADENALQVTVTRNSKLAKQPGSLGVLENLNEWFAKWSGKSPQVLRPLVCLFAGNHAVLEAGYSSLESGATADQVSQISAGGAAINQICASNDLGLKVFDLALAYPVNNITKDASFDERGCAATIAFGMEAIAGGADLLCFSGLGAGNDVSTSAIFSALTTSDGGEFLLETAHDTKDANKLKEKLVSEALSLNQSQLSDPLEVLRRLGGRETAAIAGAILAARVQHIPVFLDGHEAMAAALVLKSMNDAAIDHCQLAHLHNDLVHHKMAGALGLKPVLELGISDGQGSGGALAMGVMKSAALTHSQMQSGSSA